MKMAHRLNFSNQELGDLEFASMLHDIGKLGSPSEILNKPEKLSVDEFELIKNHPQIGYDILEGISFLEKCRTILLHHHERVDGNGYPHGLKGNDINISSKILAIADAYDAMTSSRPYRSFPLTVEDALDELEQSKGTHFDEKLADVFIQMIRQEQAETV